MGIAGLLFHGVFLLLQVCPGKNFYHALTFQMPSPFFLNFESSILFHNFLQQDITVSSDCLHFHSPLTSFPESGMKNPPAFTGGAVL